MLGSKSEVWATGLRSPVCAGGIIVLVSTKWLPHSRKEFSAIANKGSAGVGAAALTVLKTRCRSKWKIRSLSTGSPERPHGPAGERFSHTWPVHFDQGTVVGTGLDDAVHYACHLGSNGDELFAGKVGVVPVLRDVALELVAEAVLPLPDGHLGCQP